MWRTKPIKISVTPSSKNRCLAHLAEDIHLEKLVLANMFQSLTQIDYDIKKLNVFTSNESLGSLYSVFTSTDVNFSHLDIKRIAKSLTRIEGPTLFCLAGAPNVTSSINAGHLHSVNPYYQELYLKELFSENSVSADYFCDQPMVFNKKCKQQKFPLFDESKRDLIKKMKVGSGFFRAKNVVDEKKLPPGFASQCMVISKPTQEKAKKIAFWEFQVSEGDGLNLSSADMLEYIKNWYGEVSGKDFSQIKSLYFSTKSLPLKGYLMSAPIKSSPKIFSSQMAADACGFNSAATLMHAIEFDESAVVVCFDTYPKILIGGVWE